MPYLIAEDTRISFLRNRTAVIPKEEKNKAGFVEQR